MRVSSSWVVEILTSPGGSTMVGCIRSEPPTDLWKHLFIHEPLRERCFEPVFRIGIFDIVAGMEELGKQVIFVIATTPIEG